MDEPIYRFGLILRWKCGLEYAVLLNETVQRKYMSIAIKIKDNSLELYIVCLSKMSLDKANNLLEHFSYLLSIQFHSI